MLSYIPVAKTLVVGCAGLEAAHHGARYVNNGAAASTMMAKPSQPVPRNIKDTVSSLRAAVQVRSVFALAAGPVGGVQVLASIGCRSSSVDSSLPEGLVCHLVLKESQQSQLKWSTAHLQH